MRVPRSLRHLTLLLVVFVLASCGGGGDSNSSDPTNVAPTASLRLASNVPVNAVVTLDGSGSGGAGGRAVTYAWVMTSKPAGSAATLSNPTTVSPTFTPDLVGTYAFTLTVNDGSKTTTVAGTSTASAYTPPTIVADLVEPVSGSVQLSLSFDPGASTITWTADGTAINTGSPVTWDTTTFANGAHVVNAHLQFAANYTLDVARTFQVTQTTVSFFGPAISENAGVYYAIAGAQSAYGIARVDATLDGVAVGSLTARNNCLDVTGAACTSTGPNAYAFTGTVRSGTHLVVITATDNAGNLLGTQLRFVVTDVP